MKRQLAVFQVTLSVCTVLICLAEILSIGSEPLMQYLYYLKILFLLGILASAIISYKLNNEDAKIALKIRRITDGHINEFHSLENANSYLGESIYKLVENIYTQLRNIKE